jgi:predicted ATP-grasp superfamily ATP-dependent carboligase
VDALVTDTHTRASVAGLRALGRAGLDVMALAPRSTAAGTWSRCAAAAAVGPDVLGDPHGFVDRIAALAREHGPFLIYPVQEESIDALYAGASTLPAGAAQPYPGEEQVRRLRDKRDLPALASDAGLATAATIAEASAAELLKADLPVPCVVKPVTKGGAIGTARPVASHAELRELLATLPLDEPLVVQERLIGPLLSVGIVVARDGRIVARFQHLATRTWPADAGSSALATSVAPDERLIERAAQLLAGAGYWGLAELEFVGAPAGPALIDINPRFYGCMPLPLACGVNLPAAWHAVAVDGPLPSPGPYRLGVTYRWLKADVIAAVRGDLSRLLSRSRSPRTGAMWMSGDPAPGAVLAAGRRGERLLGLLPRRRTVLTASAPPAPR